MKKITLLALFTLSIISCNNLKDNEFLISGTANGIENGKKVFVEIQDENGVIAKDTGVIENGKFELKGSTDNIDLGFIRIENEKINLPIILEEGKIKINIVKDSLQKSTIEGTFNNDKFQKFNNESVAILEKVKKFEKENNPKMQKALTENDTVTVNKIKKEYKNFQNDMNDYSKTFIKNNPDAFISVLLLENFLMREYIPATEIKSFYDKLDKKLVNTKSAQNIKKTLDLMLAVVVGKPAPKFSAKSPEGKLISLDESLGKVTIVDFWASWCAPCRKENPNVVALYNEYHSKGLNIIGVSLDQDAKKWKDAIAKDNLSWIHVSNLKYWDEPIGKQYGISSIPATFILDAKGNIVAKDLRGDALRAKVKELLDAK
ncbi:MAG: AhpC/TSA family protein [Flavobacterium sp.]|jgi:peroxiredoxin|uniref:TlpA disulfide reductase family protein n=1 Tax=Flavobacterium sp. TaxID=239 RepID=UPI0025C42F08|nr:TlpA disulfide reductase family protein [Flavobacterium sp.]MCA1965962.1 AhpC/TSA family protein [Flavobacterium sp.]